MARQHKIVHARDFDKCQVPSCSCLATQSQYCHAHSSRRPVDTPVHDPGGAEAAFTRTDPPKRPLASHRNCIQKETAQRTTYTNIFKCPGCRLDVPSQQLCHSCRNVLDRHFQSGTSISAQMCTTNSRPCLNSNCIADGQETYHGLCMKCWECLRKFHANQNDDIKPTRCHINSPSQQYSPANATGKPYQIINYDNHLPSEYQSAKYEQDIHKAHEFTPATRCDDSRTHDNVFDTSNPQKCLKPSCTNFGNDRCGGFCNSCHSQQFVR